MNPDDRADDYRTGNTTVRAFGQWDTPQATALLVLGALGFLILVRHGFRGVLVNLGA